MHARQRPHGTHARRADAGDGTWALGCARRYKRRCGLLSFASRFSAVSSLSVSPADDPPFQKAKSLTFRKVVSLRFRLFVSVPDANDSLPSPLLCLSRPFYRKTRLTTRQHELVHAGCCQRDVTAQGAKPVALRTSLAAAGAAHIPEPQPHRPQRSWSPNADTRCGFWSSLIAGHAFAWGVLLPTVHRC